MAAFEKFGDSIASVFYLAFAFAWTFGGIAGAVYWASEGEAWKVLWSLVIPLYGAITVMGDVLF